MSEFIFVQTTVNSEEDAARLSRMIVESRLAACVTASAPVISRYRWHDGLEEETEIVLTIKTVSGNYPFLEKMLRENHSYELPEIVYFSIGGGEDRYLEWLRENSRPR